jgi:hypothetical protein
VGSFIVYVWSGPRGTYNVAAISTQDDVFADKLKRWAELEGYSVEIKKDSSDGSQHQRRATGAGHEVGG